MKKIKPVKNETLKSFIERNVNKGISEDELKKIFFEVQRENKQSEKIIYK